MSLTTRCPACGTLFKVVPDQLRISDGWVRCGRCSEVFDAQIHLTQDAPAAPGRAADDRAPTPAPVPASGTDAVATSAAPKTPSDDLDAELAARLAEIAEAIAQNDPDPEARATFGATAVPDRAVAGVSAAPASVLPDTLFPAPDSVADGEPVFVQQANRRAFWRKPLVRAGLRLLGVGLAVLLVGQVVRQERDRIVAHAPGLSGVVQALCEPLRCQLRPWRQADAVLIESSTFARTSPKTFRLSVVLRNKGAVRLATPAVEITLTDTGDQVIVRRAVLPTDFAPADPAIEPGGELSRNLTLGLTDDVDAGRVTGYRVVAFYP